MQATSGSDPGGGRFGLRGDDGSAGFTGFVGAGHGPACAKAGDAHPSAAAAVTPARIRRNKRKRIIVRLDGSGKATAVFALSGRPPRQGAVLKVDLDGA